MSAEEPKPKPPEPTRRGAPLGGGDKPSPFRPRRSLAYLFGAFAVFTFLALGRPQGWSALERPAELAVRFAETPAALVESAPRGLLPLPRTAFVEGAARALQVASWELLTAAERAEGERAERLERDGRELALRALILRAIAIDGRDPALDGELEGYARERRGDPALDAVLRVWGPPDTRGRPVGPVTEAEFAAARALAGSLSGDRLLAGLHRIDGDEAAAKGVERRAQRDRERRAARSGGVVVVLLALVGAGFVCLAWLAFSRRRDLRVGRAELPPGDSAPLGFDLFARGLFAAMLAMALIGALAAVTPLEIAPGFTSVLVWTPLVLLAVRHVGPGAGRTASSFGLVLAPRAVAKLVPTVLAVFAVQSCGFFVIALVSGNLFGSEIPSRAIEIWALGSAGERTGLFVEAAIWAPLFEELAFRGLLFGALRARMGFGPAAFASSILFAAIHPYGVGALLPLTWLAIVFCWAYERTRSLWTPILLHVLHNGAALAVATLWWD